MVGMFGFLRPVIEIKSMIMERIGFQNQVHGHVSRTYRFPVTEATKITEVDKFKIKKYFLKLKESWRIRVLLNGNPSEMYLKPIDLLKYSQIIFEYRIIEHRRSVFARGLREASSHWLAQLRGFGYITNRNRIYRQTAEEEFGLKDIGETRLITLENEEHTREDHDSLIANELDKAVPHIPSKLENSVVGDKQPIGVNGILDLSLKYHQPSLVGDMMVAKIPIGDVNQEIQQLYEHAIVACLVGIGKASEDDKVESYMNDHYGPFRISKHKNGFYVIYITNGADKYKLLEQPQIIINNKPLILKKWTLNPSWNASEFLAKIPVWVKFPGLELQYWSPRSLSRICSIIGDPLFCDHPTGMREITEYARVCIEIEVGHELPDTVFFVGGDNEKMMEQAVEYEWRPCGNCFSLLHVTSKCSLTSTSDESSKNLGQKEKLLNLLVDDKDTALKKPAEYCCSITSDDSASMTEGRNSTDTLSGDSETSIDDGISDEVIGLTIDSDEGDGCDSTEIKVNSYSNTATSFAMETMMNYESSTDESEDEQFYSPPTSFSKIEEMVP